MSKDAFEFRSSYGNKQGPRCDKKSTIQRITIVVSIQQEGTRRSINMACKLSRLTNYTFLPMCKLREEPVLLKSLIKQYLIGQDPHPPPPPYGRGDYWKVVSHLSHKLTNFTNIIRDVNKCLHGVRHCGLVLFTIERTSLNIHKKTCLLRESVW